MNFVLISIILVISLNFVFAEKDNLQILDCSASLPPNDDGQWLRNCPENAKCDSLDINCYSCRCPLKCYYGMEAASICTVRPEVGECIGNRTVEKTFRCQFCFQAYERDYECEQKYHCNSAAPPGPKQYYTTNCTVHDSVLCLGNRQFLRKQKCSWVSGYSWTSATFWSATLGGLGADRFYVGHWKQGLGKIFSFGGLGIWTLIDAILVPLGYITPSDGSIYAP